jgi:hypothetical protein
MSEPRSIRPTFSGYGVSTDPEGMLPWAWARDRLADAHNYWLATSGPHASPVWALWRDGGVVFSCGPASRKARAIARDPRVVLHLESGDEVVILEGAAIRLEPTDELLEEYARKYQPVAADVGNWFRIHPSRVFAWRERDYLESATRFDFG